MERDRTDESECGGYHVVRQTVSERGSQTSPTIDELKHVVIGLRIFLFFLVFQDVLNNREGDVSSNVARLSCK